MAKIFSFQRFPTVFGTDFEAFLYVSVICPTDWDGRPPAGINYFKLKIRRKSRLFFSDADFVALCSLIPNYFETLYNLL